MLTTWKQTRTTIEYPSTTSGANRDSSGDATRKKKKTKKSQSSEEEKEAHAELFHTTTQDDDHVAVVMGAQFVPPLSHHSSYHRERIHASLSSLGKSSKKRRKINNEATTVEKEPILCITSPHRVVFMENKGENSANDGTMIESKSRTYVSRPGTSSRFTLHGNIGKYPSLTSGKNGSDNGPSAALAFAGMISPGAKYDPASNLIYAIRNGGAEIAIWSAVSSLTLPGPDDDVGASRINGTTSERTDAHESSSADAIISSRLKLPRGKNAVTLTPISIPASSLEGKETIGVDGAVGCCEDGSIWLAIRHLSNGKCSKFQILVVDESSNEVVEPSSTKYGVKATKRRKTSITNKNGGLRLLDSSATGTIDKSVVQISMHSVLLSGDNAQVVYRSHQLRVENEEVSSDVQRAVHIERCTTISCN